MKRILVSCIALAVAACSPAMGPVGPRPAPSAPPLAKGAATVIDQTRCETEASRLRPFVITWDVTEQAGFSGEAQKSIAVVKLAGCKLELLDTCQVEGTYRARETPTALQTLAIANEDQLYAQIPLGVASLQGHLRSSGSLQLTYAIHGMSYASAPALYRSQLGAGCEGATHFVLNYATGAYAVSSAAGSGADARASAFGAGAGGATESTSSALFKGGDVSACDKGSASCDSPVRLRLVPITDGAPPADLADAASVAAKATPTPAADPQQQQPLGMAEIATSVKLGRPAMTACYEKELATSSAAAGKVMVHFAIGGDGFVGQVTTAVEGKLDATIESCIRDVFYSLRFRGAGTETNVNYPIIFTSDDSGVAPVAPHGAFGAIAGQWQGGVQPASGAATPVTAVFLEDAAPGQKIGSIDYPRLGCSGDLIRVGADAGEMRVRESIVRGADKCASGRMIRVEAMGETGRKADAVKLYWLGANGAIEATGALAP